MAKLTDRQKNNILAKWNTGTFTKVSLAKKYKVSEKIVRNIIDGQAPLHSDLVEQQVLINQRKKSELSPIEIQAVNSAVSSIESNRVLINELSKNLLSKVSAMVENGKAQKVVTVGSGQGCSSSEVVEYDLQSSDYKNLADTIDKASVTLGVNERFSSSKIEVNNSNQQATIPQINISIDE